MSQTQTTPKSTNPGTENKPQKKQTTSTAIKTLDELEHQVTVLKLSAPQGSVLELEVTKGVLKDILRHNYKDDLSMFYKDVKLYEEGKKAIVVKQESGDYRDKQFGESKLRIEAGTQAMGAGSES